MVRLMSEREAMNSTKNKACPKAVLKLPIVEIEEKHCKIIEQPIQGKIKPKKRKQKEIEAPTCAICVELIQLGNKGMFMPCGHVYHPGCLQPWF